MVQRRFLVNFHLADKIKKKKNESKRKSKREGQTGRRVGIEMGGKESE